VLSEDSVLLVGSHVKQRLILAEATCDVVAGLVGISVVNLGQLGVVADQQ
jgi:hypothetical protein